MITFCICLIYYGVALFVYQVHGWLNAGIWTPFPVRRVWEGFFGSPQPTATPVDALVDWLLAWPMTSPVRALDYSARYQTANGEVMAAPVTLRDMRIGGSGIEDIPATVTRAPLNISLLGMSFLRRLAGYEVRSDGLVLRF